MATLAKMLKADAVDATVPTAEDLLDPDVADFVAEVDDLLGRLDDLPDRAEDFAESVREKLTSIRGWCVAENACTDRQQQAVDNMAGGVERWGA
jgi:hypothetical protein